MAQQSVDGVGKTRSSSGATEHAKLIWLQPAHSIQAAASTLHHRPDRWQHPTTCPALLFSLASAGASTEDDLDGCHAFGNSNEIDKLDGCHAVVLLPVWRGLGLQVFVMPDLVRHPLVGAGVASLDEYQN